MDWQKWDYWATDKRWTGRYGLVGGQIRDGQADMGIVGGQIGVGQTDMGLFGGQVGDEQVDKGVSWARDKR